MSTLVDFLLARIAEDEERAQFVQRQIEGSNYRPSDPWRLSWHDEYDLLCIEPTRALAECEANRRIIEWTVSVEGALRREGECHDAPLRLLALPYADHPDFREEWRASDS